MKNRLTIAATILVSGFALGACGGESGADVDPEVVDAIDQAESELAQFAEEIEAVDREDLESAWQTVEDEVENAVESLRSGETIDTQAIEQDLDEFQEEIESSDVGAEIEEAWEDLRATLDQMMADAS